MFVNKLISTFGDHQSLYPLATKDIVNSLGMTAYSYENGGTDKESKKIDAQDRFIDEFGTEFIWLGGLPFFKWGANNTIYKLKKFNPDVDVRLISDKDQLSVAKKYAKAFSEKLSKPDILKDLTKAEMNPKAFKGLFLGKFAAATILTLASYFSLTVLKQKHTEKQVVKRMMQKMAQEEQYKKNFSQHPTFKAFLLEEPNTDNTKTDNKKKANNKPAFKGLQSVLSSFMFNPVHNMFIVDAGITSERLIMARNKHERVEYGIKEASLLFFMYVAGKYVQKGIEWASSKFFKKPIDLHIDFMSSDTLKNAMKTPGAIEKHLGAFDKVVEQANAAKSNKAIFEFLYDSANDNNLLVRAAKKSGILNVIDESTTKPNMLQRFINIFKVPTRSEFGKVDPHQFIKVDEIKDLAKNIKAFAETQKAAELKNSKNTVENFIKSAKRFKVGSVAANIGLSCLFLGVIVPFCMKKYKEKYYGEGSHIQDSAQKRLQMSFKGNIA